MATQRSDEQLTSRTVSYLNDPHAGLSDLQLSPKFDFVGELPTGVYTMNDVEHLLLSALHRANDAFASAEPHEYKRHIASLLDLHPAFTGHRVVSFSPSQTLFLDPDSQAPTVIRIAKKRGANEALKWCKKIFGMAAADRRLSLVVHGLRLERTITLSNGVTLTPLADIDSSPNGIALRREFRATRFAMDRPFHQEPIFATLPVINDPARDERGIEEIHPRMQQLMSTVLAFTLVDDCAPTLGISWADFIDPDFAEAQGGRGWMAPHSDVQSFAFSPSEVDDEAVAWVEKYLGLCTAARNLCEVAIPSLNFHAQELT